VNDPTDGGIVLFGSPGSIVENNIIWVTNVSHNYCMAMPVSPQTYRRSRTHHLVA